mgnify:CR=1 FL=1
MSYDQRIEPALRPAAYRLQAESLLQFSNPTTSNGATKNSITSSAIEETISGTVTPSINQTNSGHVSDSTSSPDPQTMSLTFADLLDIINPFQHIPGISTAYRSITGDAISAPARIAGSALYFGPIGVASAIANVASENITGKDIGDNIVSWFTNESDTSIAQVSHDTSNFQEVKPEAAQQNKLGSQPYGEPMSPNEPFTLDTPSTNPIAEVARTIKFSDSSEPISLNALPIDILSALYSGQPLRSGDDTQWNNFEKTQEDPPINSRDTSFIQSPNETESAPRWNLWSSPEETVTIKRAASLAYGGALTSLSSPEEIKLDNSITEGAAWSAATASEVMARYQDSLNLQKRTSQNYLDVAQ